MQREQMRLYTCSGLRIFHHGVICSLDQAGLMKKNQGQDYSSVRFSRWMKLMPYVLDKWNIEVYHDEVGK